jgi:hypothetical protein
MVVVMLAAKSIAADTQIHRCLLEDGTFAFQETPCPEPAVHVDISSKDDTPAAYDDAFDFVNPFDEPENPSTLAEPASKDRAVCEKATRDEIDAIDLKMHENAYTKEQGKEYLAELLSLTQQLRACKRL